MRAVLDACVLYPTVLREILIGAASAGAFTPLWSERLLEEWRRTAARRGGPLDEARARAEIARLSARFPEAKIPPDPGCEAALWLPDSGDIHVLASAIAGSAALIITLNLRDFPAREIAPHGVTALHPDPVLTEAWLDRPEPIEAVVAAVIAEAEAASPDPLDRRALLKRARLPRLAKALHRTGAL